MYTTEENMIPQIIHFDPLCSVLCPLKQTFSKIHRRLPLKHIFLNFASHFISMCRVMYCTEEDLANVFALSYDYLICFLTSKNG